MPIICVFLLGNLVILIYMVIQMCVKTALFISDAFSSYEIALFRSTYNLIASSIYLCC